MQPIEFELNGILETFNSKYFQVKHLILNQQWNEIEINVFNMQSD